MSLRSPRSITARCRPKDVSRSQAIQTPTGSWSATNDPNHGSTWSQWSSYKPISASRTSVTRTTYVLWHESVIVAWPSITTKCNVTRDQEDGIACKSYQVDEPRRIQPITPPTLTKPQSTTETKHVARSIRSCWWTTNTHGTVKTSKQLKQSDCTRSQGSKTVASWT